MGMAKRTWRCGVKQQRRRGARGGGRRMARRGEEPATMKAERMLPALYAFQRVVSRVRVQRPTLLFPALLRPPPRALYPLALAHSPRQLRLSPPAGM